MRENGRRKDICILAVVAVLAALGVWLFSRHPVQTLGPRARVDREYGSGLLLVDGRVLIDINAARADLLRELPGIGPALAQSIVEYRRENGPFRAVEELTRVSGIGEKKLEGFRDRIAVAAPPPAQSASPEE